MLNQSTIERLRAVALSPGELLIDGQVCAARAGQTLYGLSAVVMTRDMGCAHRVVSGLRAGVVHVNTYAGADVSVPLGGWVQSGHGHDKSPHALDKFRNLKTAWFAL